MLVKKGDKLIKPVDKDMAEAWEVLLADEEYFVVGRVRAEAEKNSGMYRLSTDFEFPQIYSNVESIGKLIDYNFVQVKGFYVEGGELQCKF